MNTLRERFAYMRSVIIEQDEITETELVLLLDDKGIGHATYNKIKRDFRVNALKVGIEYDKKTKTYRAGPKQESLTSYTKEERSKLV